MDKLLVNRSILLYNKITKYCAFRLKEIAQFWSLYVLAEYIEPNVLYAGVSETIKSRRAKQMPVVNELIRKEADGSVSFGNYLLEKKSKLEDFEHKGDLYKVKTFKEITKLEKNGLFVYESVPGTAVNHLIVTDQGMEFKVCGYDDSQITVELESACEYIIFINDNRAGKMKTNLGGKLVLSVELADGKEAFVKIQKQ